MIERGTRIGVYEIIGPLGAGGMGEVYRARDTRLGRTVALKLLPDLFAHDPDRLARFQREAQLLAALNHPHIAGIYGFEDAGDIQALALEFVDGPTLADRIAQGAIPLDEALPIALQIADALEAAHAQGIVHRDLKPANIKLRPDGTVKVLDFGLAKALDPLATDTHAANPSISPTMTAATQLGMVLGTAAYMSPEQAKGKAVDKRADNWAFGCVLYEMLTGQRPFPGEDVSDVLAFVITKEPDWTALPASTPSAIRRLLRRTFQKDRKHRLADIADARLEIEDARVEPSETGASIGRPRASWKAFVPWAVAATALIALGIVSGPWRRSSAPGGSPPVTRFTLALEREHLFALTGRTILGISNDGTMAAHVAASQIFLRRFSDLDFRRLPGTETGAGSNSPVFSPDGRSLAFHTTAEGAVQRIELSGGAAVRVCSVEPPVGMSWTASGILVGQGPKGIVRCPSTGGTAETLATVGEGEEAHGPQLLSDGDTLLFTVARRDDGPSRWDKAKIVAHSLRSGERKTIVDGGSDGRYVRSGHLLYALGGIVLAVPFDARQLEVKGGPVPVIEGVRRALAGTTGIAQFATSDSGNLVYVPGPAARTSTERALGVADRTGAVTPLKLPEAAYSHVRASRDGSHLVIGTDDGRDASVWIYRLDGTRSIQRLTVQHQNRFPIWSPDGERIAFQSNREGDFAIFSQRADGTGTAERLTKPGKDEEHVPESWSPDGAHMLFSVAKDGGSSYSLSILSMRDKTSVVVKGVESEQPIGAVFSPDGRWFTYRVGRRGGGPRETRGVYVQPFPPSGSVYPLPQESLDFHPIWSPAGNEIVFVPTAASGQLAAVPFNTRQGVTFGVPVMMPAMVTASRTSGQTRAHDILPDGRFVGPLQTDQPNAVQPNAEIRVVLNWFEELKQRVPQPR